jgi:ethanolamine utilization protein EutN
MILGRVVGRITSTIHHPIVTGRRLLLVDRVDGAGYLISMDSVGAGAGETVLVLDEGSGARQVMGEPTAPIRSIVVGIVDLDPEE